MWALLFLLATDFSAEGMKALEERKYQEAAGQFAQAEENYKAAAELDPKSPAAQLGLAHSQARQKRLPEAAEHFRRAAVLDASYKDGLLELASLLEENKQPQDAIAIYREFPDNTVAQGRLGELLIETKRYPEAI